MKATIILPTTSDRGPLLPYSASSALRQSEKSIELLVIGDGVNNATRQISTKLEQSDSRVRFFDFPKHARRGEGYRHKVLTEQARGEIVCYLCDRDLMLSNHVETVYQALQANDIVSTLSYRIAESGSVTMARIDPMNLTDGARPKMRRLTCVAHTMRAYRALPFGWRTTPEGQFTDIYMWDQFLQQESTRSMIVPLSTILYLPRGSHPGWPTERRLIELKRWHSVLASDNGDREIHQRCMSALMQSFSELERDVRKNYVRKGKWRRRLETPSGILLRRFFRKFGIGDTD